MFFYGTLRAKNTPEQILKKILRPLGECYEKNGDDAKAAEAYEAYTALPGVADADASYLKAFLREKQILNPPKRFIWGTLRHIRMTVEVLSGLA